MCTRSCGKVNTRDRDKVVDRETRKQTLQGPNEPSAGFHRAPRTVTVTRVTRVFMRRIRSPRLVNTTRVHITARRIRSVAFTSGTYVHVTRVAHVLTGFHERKSRVRVRCVRRGTKNVISTFLSASIPVCFRNIRIAKQNDTCLRHAQSETDRKRFFARLENTQTVFDDPVKPCEFNPTRRHESVSRVDREKPTACVDGRDLGGEATCTTPFTNRRTGREISPPAIVGSPSSSGPSGRKRRDTRDDATASPHRAWNGYSR